MPVLTISCLRDNYAYAVCAVGSSRVVLVDPSDALAVGRAIKERGLTVAALLCTHHHADHMGGLHTLLRETPGVPVIAHPILLRSSALPVTVNEDGDRVEIAGVGITVLFTPGHTKDSVSFLMGDGVFTGDTLFVSGCGRLFDGTAEEMYASLGRLGALPPATRVYSGHEYALHNLGFAVALEPDNVALLERQARVVSLRREGLPSVPSTIGEELRTNPFLRVSEPRLRGALGISENTSNVEAFAILRREKDGYRG